MKLLAQILVCAAASMCGSTALAQSYPSKPVRLIVGFPPGGPADLFARALAQGLSVQLGQPVIVDNRAGAGGVVGVDAAAKAAPDGYTLAMNSSSAMAISPFTLAAMPFDPRRDLALISLVVKVPEVVVTHPSLPVGSLAELVAHARANPAKVNFGSAGSGSITHLAGELLKVEAQIDLVHVPYKGAAPAVNDLLGAQVQMAILDVPAVLSHIRAGKLRALAVTSAKRAASLPEVPTTAEANYPRVISDNWYGLVAPAATPPGVLKRIHAAAMVALQSAVVVDQFEKVSGAAAPSTPEEYAAFLAIEQAKWSAIVKAIGFKE